MDDTTTTTIPMQEIEELSVETAEMDGGEPQATHSHSHRRVRDGELYYVEDEAAPEGWSIVEISSDDANTLAAFAVGQTEAIPLTEIEDRILGAVPRPRVSSPRIAA